MFDFIPEPIKFLASYIFLFLMCFLISGDVVIKFFSKPIFEKLPCQGTIIFLVMFFFGPIITFFVIIFGLINFIRISIQDYMNNIKKF